MLCDFSFVRCRSAGRFLFFLFFFLDCVLFSSVSFFMRSVEFSKRFASSTVIIEREGTFVKRLTFTNAKALFAP